MAQHDYVIDNSDGLTVRNDINSVLSAIQSMNSGTTSPTVTIAYMFWVDTTAALLKQRNAADTAWIAKGELAREEGLYFAKNKLINGNFDLWQRGTSFTVSQAYTADRWWALFLSGGGGAGIVTRQAFTLGQTDVPGEPKYFYRHDQTTLMTTSNVFVRQRIEGVRTFAGQSVKLGFWAKAGSARTFRARLVQDFGTGGAPSAGVQTAVLNFSVTTSWQKFTFTFLLASITGKTLGTDGNNSLFVDILDNSTTAIFTFDLASVQLEAGSVASDFEQRPLGLELVLAQRYYQKTFPFDVAPAQNAGQLGSLFYRVHTAGAGNNTVEWGHKVTMRITPTVTFFNPSASNSNWFNATDVSDSAAPNVEAAPSSESRTYIRNGQVAGDGIGERLMLQATADAEI